MDPNNNENDLEVVFNPPTDNSNSTESSNFNFNQYPSIISFLIYLIRETKLYIFFKNKKDIIKKSFDRNKEVNKIFYYVLDSLEYLDNKQKLYFKQCANNIQNFIDNSLKTDKSSVISSMILDKSQFFESLENTILIFFDKIIYDYSKKLIIKENNIAVIHSNKLTDKSSEEEAIKDFEEELSKKPKGIKDYYNLLFFILFSFENVKLGKYKMKIRYFLSFNMKNIYEFMKQNKINTEKEITLEDCFDYYYKTEGMIYKSPEIMLISFIIESTEHKINYNNNKEFEIKLIKGMHVNYKIAGIIYEKNDEFFAIISENLEGKKWKKYNSEGQIDIENENKLDYSLPKPTILIYRREEKI